MALIREGMFFPFNFKPHKKILIYSCKSLNYNHVSKTIDNFDQSI